FLGLVMEPVEEPDWPGFPIWTWLPPPLTLEVGGRPMTEAEWLEGTEPKRMLAFRQGKAFWRKRLLYHCACCRLIWQLLTTEGSREAVAVCECYADGLAAEGEVAASKGAALAAWQRTQEVGTARGQALSDLCRRTGSIDWGGPECCRYRLAV